MTWWPELRYRFKPKRELTLKEINELLNAYFQNRAFDQKFVEELSDDLQEQFEEREEPKKERKNDSFIV